MFCPCAGSHSNLCLSRSCHSGAALKALSWVLVNTGPSEHRKQKGRREFFGSSPGAGFNSFKYSRSFRQKSGFQPITFLQTTLDNFVWFSLVPLAFWALVSDRWSKSQLWWALRFWRVCLAVVWLYGRAIISATCGMGHGSKLHAYQNGCRAAVLLWEEVSLWGFALGVCELAEVVMVNAFWWFFFCFYFSPPTRGKAVP